MPDRRRLVVFSRPVGLFSLYLQVLGQAWLCRQSDIIPIVYFNSGCLYWSDSDRYGARNVWEYYFEPLSPYRITDVAEADEARLEHCTIWEFSRRETDPFIRPPESTMTIGSIPVSAGTVVSAAFPSNVVDWVWEMPRKRKLQLHCEIADSIRLRQTVSQKIDRFCETEMAGSRVLGVHIRGAERAPERALFAPDGMLPIDHYLREVDAYMGEHPKSLIFCATDTQWPLDLLRERYGPSVLSYPAQRLGRAEEAVGLHHLPPGQVDRGRLGEEVLIEGYLLSKCDFLIHGPSNVSLAATLLSPSLDHVDIYAKYGYDNAKHRYAYWKYRHAIRLLLGPLGMRRVQHAIGQLRRRR